MFDIRKFKPWKDEDTPKLLADIQKKKTIEELSTLYGKSVSQIRGILRGVAVDYYFYQNKSKEEIEEYTGLTPEVINTALSNKQYRMDVEEKKNEGRSHLTESFIKTQTHSFIKTETSIQSYSDKFEIVKNAIITGCKDRIDLYWPIAKDFDEWLCCDGESEFTSMYKDLFNEEFEKYMTPTIELILYISAKNAVYAIRTHLNKTSTLDDILCFTGDFIEMQLHDFDNTCEEIRQAMYEEECEYKRTCEEAERVTRCVSGNMLKNQ